MLQNILWIGGAFVAFAAVHSLTAGAPFPGWLKKHVSPRSVDGWYRLAYNLFSVVTFLPVLFLAAALPDTSIYSLVGFTAVLMRGIQLIALLALAWALWSIDFLRFVGLRQAVAFLDGSPLPLPAEQLQRRGLYALTRHPLYVFSLVLLWVTPTLSLNGAIFNVCSALYFIIGASIEERRMARMFGDAYHDYRRDVPALAFRGRRQGEKAGSSR